VTNGFFTAFSRLFHGFFTAFSRLFHGFFTAFYEKAVPKTTTRLFTYFFGTAFFEKAVKPYQNNLYLWRKTPIFIRG
jgi:hypothetical protein